MRLPQGSGSPEAPQKKKGAGAGEFTDWRSSQHAEKTVLCPGRPYPGSTFSSDRGFFLAEAGEVPVRLLSTRWCCREKPLGVCGAPRHTDRREPARSWEGIPKERRSAPMALNRKRHSDRPPPHHGIPGCLGVVTVNTESPSLAASLSSRDSATRPAEPLRGRG